MTNLAKKSALQVIKKKYSQSILPLTLAYNDITECMIGSDWYQGLNSVKRCSAFSSYIRLQSVLQSFLYCTDEEILKEVEEYRDYIDLDTSLSELERNTDFVSEVMQCNDQSYHTALREKSGRIAELLREIYSL